MTRRAVVVARVLPGLLLRVALLWALALPARAEFYRWVDDSGQTRISNVPPRGIRADGSIASRWHPHSVVAQHARMRERLQRAGERIERERSEVRLHGSASESGMAGANR